MNIKSPSLQWFVNSTAGRGQECNTESMQCLVDVNEPCLRPLLLITRHAVSQSARAMLLITNAQSVLCVVLSRGSLWKIRQLQTLPQWDILCACIEHDVKSRTPKVMTRPCFEFHSSAMVTGYENVAPYIAYREKRKFICFSGKVSKLWNYDGGDLKHVFEWIFKNSTSYMRHFLYSLIT